MQSLTKYININNGYSNIDESLNNNIRMINESQLIIEHGKEGTYTANVVRPIMEEYFNISTENKANEKVQNVVQNKIEY